MLTAHPDKGGSEAKMATVNEAYEVLSDPGTPRILLVFKTSFVSSDSPYTELRQRYDNGDDPNDPTAQQGGNPFQGGGFPGQFAQFFQGGSFGGFPGGGGGFQFRYSQPGYH